LEKFKDEKHLLNDILSILAKEEISISGIHKILGQNGNNVHRLILTGYLDALVDQGILRRREVKPSRIYSLNTPAGKDVYDIVGTIARKVSSDNSGDDALLLLCYIFNRPIFSRELERCNVDLPVNYKRVTSPRKSEYLSILEKQGIKIAPSNMLMEPSEISQERLLKLIRELMNITLDIKKYTPVDSEVSQKTLESEDC
jgi:DNA-binding HxlR family transcriptional regulator